MADSKNSRNIWRAAIILCVLLGVVPALRGKVTAPAAASTLPVFGHPIPAAAQKLEPEQKEYTFACDIGAYVRAADLFPGQRAYGEARLVANGSSAELAHAGAVRGAAPYSRHPCPEAASIQQHQTGGILRQQDFALR